MPTLDPTYILKRPIITEKSTDMSSGLIKKGARAGEPINRYSFEVDKRARKEQIRAAVEQVYGVRVTRVATQIRKGKHFRTRFGPAKKPDWKKAIVQLHPDDRIDLF
jgi:large subunit ribosomal protein L23